MGAGIFSQIKTVHCPWTYKKNEHMKTAMQIAIESYKNDGVSFTDWFIDNYQMLIEKEKEQIVDAFELGYKSCDLDEAFEINRKLASGELYYDKNYNQNK